MHRAAGGVKAQRPSSDEAAAALSAMVCGKRRDPVISPGVAEVWGLLSSQVATKAFEHGSLH